MAKGEPETFREHWAATWGRARHDWAFWRWIIGSTLTAGAILWLGGWLGATVSWLVKTANVPVWFALLVAALLAINLHDRISMRNADRIRSESKGTDLAKIRAPEPARIIDSTLGVQWELKKPTAEWLNHEGLDEYSRSYLGKLVHVGNNCYTPLRVPDRMGDFVRDKCPYCKEPIPIHKAMERSYYDREPRSQIHYYVLQGAMIQAIRRAHMRDIEIVDGLVIDDVTYELGH